MGIDLGLQFGDLAFRERDHVSAGDEPCRWRRLLSEYHDGTRELVGVAGLLPVLRLPPLALRSA